MHVRTAAARALVLSMREARTLAIANTVKAQSAVHVGRVRLDYLQV